jgi:endonuclease G
MKNLAKLLRSLLLLFVVVLILYQVFSGQDPLEHFGWGSDSGPALPSAEQRPSRPADVPLTPALRAHLRRPDSLVLPAVPPGQQIIRHKGFTLYYSEAREQAAWVAYPLTEAQLRNDVIDRTDDYRPDPAVATGSAELSDYSGSGYDRGHLAPSADMSWAPAAQHHSFFLSNMTPQKPGFNRDEWNQLEQHVRDLVFRHDTLLIVTGPVFGAAGPQARIGTNDVAVPNAYYKVLLDPARPTIEAVAYLLPHQAEVPHQDFRRYLVPIDSVEQRTGLDFFPGLPDAAERKLERARNVSHWTRPAS